MLFKKKNNQSRFNLINPKKSNMNSSHMTFSLSRKKATRIHKFILECVFVNCKFNYFLNLLICKVYSMADCPHLTYKDMMPFTEANSVEIEQNWSGTLGTFPVEILILWICVFIFVVEVQYGFCLSISPFICTHLRQSWECIIDYHLISQLSMVVQIYNCSPWVWGPGGLRIQGQHKRYSEFKTILCYIARAYL